MTFISSSGAASSQVGYADFVRTDPGTLAGRFMRMFWHPIYRSQDLASGRRVPVKIMGEEFTLYRGESGVVHLLAHRCAHRGTQLSVGRVEGDCIRCFYHGWKYDGSGQCVEQPAEDVSFAAKIRIRSYPTEEYLGLVFAYLGEGSPPPMLRFPELEGEGVLENHTFVRACNFFRHLELDPAHIAFVHQDSPEAESGLTGIPTIECQETDYGFVFHARRDEKVQTQHRLMPNASYFKVFPMDAESGWRDLSPADAKRVYADIGVKGSGSEFHLSYTFADTFLGVVGPTPVELVDERRANVFTSPQSFDNRMQMVNLTGSVSVTDQLKVSGNAYYRGFRQRRPDGNVSEAIACDPSGPNAGLLCLEEPDDVLFGRRANGAIVNVPIASLPNGDQTVLGGNDRVTVDSFSFGGALQAVSKAHLFDRPNQFLVGASVDLGRAHVTSQSELGVLDPRTLAGRRRSGSG